MVTEIGKLSSNNGNELNHGVQGDGAAMAGNKQVERFR